MPDNSLYTEKELLQHVANGDEQAFALLYDQYRHKVSYIAYKMLHDEADVKDVLQDIYLKIWQNRSRLSDLDNFSAYLNTLTRNHIYDRFRKKANEDAYLQHLMLKEANPDHLPDEVLYKELLTRLQEAASKLPPQQKKVFELSRMEGLKHEEIAGRLGISRETVKKHLQEALKTLRVHLLTYDNGLALLCLFYIYF